MTRIATDAHEQTAMTAWASQSEPNGWPLSAPVRASDSHFHYFWPRIQMAAAHRRGRRAQEHFPVRTGPTIISPEKTVCPCPPRAGAAV